MTAAPVRQPRRSLMWLAMIILLVFAPSAAHAQEDPQITSPATGTRLPLDEPFTVSGTGCAPGSTVQFNQSPAPVTTTAADDGSFSLELSRDVSTRNRFELFGTCGGVRIASGKYTLATPEGGQVTQVPAGGVETGGGGTAPPRERAALLGALAVSVLVAAGIHRRRTASVPTGSS